MVKAPSPPQVSRYIFYNTYIIPFPHDGVHAVPIYSNGRVSFSSLLYNCSHVIAKRHKHAEKAYTVCDLACFFIL